MKVSARRPVRPVPLPEKSGVVGDGGALAGPINVAATWEALRARKKTNF